MSNIVSNLSSPAPFDTTAERMPVKPATAPGPGTYEPAKQRVVPNVNEKPNNSFVTKAPRFVPKMPGSGMVKGPSYLENPEPGHYYTAVDWTALPSTDKTLLKYMSQMHKNQAVIPRQVPPSVPVRKLMTAGHTGTMYANDGALVNDTVGPQCYNANGQLTKSTNPSTDWHSSKDKRQLFQPINRKENTFTWPQNPGPGTYDFQKLEGKHFNLSGQNTVFQSKVPNVQGLKDGTPVPGPGTYADPRTIERRANEQIKGAADGALMGQDPVAFGTKADRGEYWKHEGETPYTRQTFARVVGPGTYEHEKKKDDIKNKILAEEAVHVAFNSSEVPFWQKKQKGGAPGPGNYIDINNPMHCSFKSQVKNLSREERHQQEEQGIKLGPFGANKDRFFQSWLQPKDGPCPGQYQRQMVRIEKAAKNKYDLAIEGRSQASTRALTAAEKERTKPNSVFLSSSDRFNKPKTSHKTARSMDKGRLGSTDTGK